MTLRRVFDDLYAAAALQGEASRQLAGGAALRVRVEGRRRQVILSQTGAPLGLVELTTFEAHGRIPEDATAVCWLPSPGGVWRVSYSWETPEVPATLWTLPEAELPADL